MNESPSVVQLTFPLVDGYLHEWLIAGPYARPIQEQVNLDSAEFKRQVIARCRLPAQPFAALPAEQTSFVIDAAGEQQQLTWRLHDCQEDHWVDLTAHDPGANYLCAWAFAQLECTVAATVSFRLTSDGPVTVWLNDELVAQSDDFSERRRNHTMWQGSLHAGHNALLVRVEQVAASATSFPFALRISGDSVHDCSVTLPSAMPLPERRRTLEAIFAAAYVEQSVFNRDQEIVVRWPADAGLSTQLGVRLQAPNGRIYSEAQPTIQPGAELKLGKAYQYPDGAYDVVLMPTAAEYFEHGLRVQRRIPVQLANNRFADAPYAPYGERLQEAISDAARRRLNLFSEIANMALDKWNMVKPAVIEAAVASINRRAEGSVLDLIGLLGMLYRFGENPAFPSALMPQLEACIGNYRYWRDEPQATSAPDSMCYTTESRQLLFHVCEVLAGQLYPAQNFSNSGRTGAWHQAKGEARALNWLQKRAAGGFQAWDSNRDFEELVLALSHLTDLAENIELAEMAAIVLDKLFFTMAVNSYKGVFGSTHGATDARMIKGGRSEATSGLSRLLWGQGAFNDQIRGVVGLACAQQYELPDLIARVATVLPDEIWSREQHAGRFEEGADGKSGDWAVNKVTYKTPDFMLCSAQDYRPGQPGAEENIWQATFGPDAVIFVNHPACLSEANARQPNAWRGNAVLPRVAQVRDALIAIHKLADDDWLGYTHAYFPTWAFDEHLLRAGWLFARKGNGYVALTAAAGLAPIYRGPSAFEEIRSFGRQNVWFAQLGRAALDGPFDAFQQQVLALDITFGDLAFHGTTLRAESLDFGWEGPLLVNEWEQPLRDFPHYENLFASVQLNAGQMAIQFLDQLMRLDFSPRV